MASILVMTLWHMDSVAAIKCNRYGLESLVAGHLRERQCALKGGPGTGV